MLKLDGSVSPPEFELPGDHPQPEGIRRKPTSMGDVNVSLALRCPICQEPYCEPKQLNCGHSFCLTCLEGSQHLYSINCPICRKATCFNVPGLHGLRLLPNNYALAQVVEAVVSRNGNSSDAKTEGVAAGDGVKDDGKEAESEDKKLCIECPQCKRNVSPSKAWFCADCDGGQKFCSLCVVERHRGSHRCINVADVNERWRVCACRLDALKTRLAPVRTALRQVACSMKDMACKHAEELEKRGDYLSRTNFVIEELLEKADTTRYCDADCQRLIDLECLLKKLEGYVSTYGAQLTTLKENVDEASNAMNKIIENVDQLEKNTRETDTEPAQLENVVVAWRGADAKTVSVAGTFTEWKPSIHLVQYKGEFLATLQLSKGKHQFKFLVDNEWRQSADYECCENGQGGHNNFVIV